MRTNANNLQSLILRRVVRVTQQRVSAALDKDASTVSRIFSGHAGVYLPEMEAFFDALGLKVIEAPDGTVTIPIDEYRALTTLARKALELQAPPDPVNQEPQ